MEMKCLSGLFLSIDHSRHLGYVTVGILLGFEDIHGPCIQPLQ